MTRVGRSQTGKCILIFGLSLFAMQLVWLAPPALAVPLVSIESSLLHFLPFLPIIWTAISFLSLALRIIAARIARFQHAYTIPTEKEDENRGNWFDVFIQEGDIIAVLPTTDSYEGDLEDLLPSPSIGLRILPAFETVIWLFSAALLWSKTGTSPDDPEVILAAFGVVSWVRITRTRTATSF